MRPYKLLKCVNGICGWRLPCIVLCVALLCGLASCRERDDGVVPDEGRGGQIVQIPIIEESNGDPEEPKQDSFKYQPSLLSLHYGSNDLPVSGGCVSIVCESYGSYDLVIRGLVYDTKVNYDIQYAVPLTAEKNAELMDILEKYDLTSWDGFYEKDDDAAADEDFYLYIDYMGGGGIDASGNTDVFPKNYEEWNAAFGAFLNAITDGISANGTLCKAELETFGKPNVLSLIVPFECVASPFDAEKKTGKITTISDDAGDVVCDVGVAVGKEAEYWSNMSRPQENPPWKHLYINGHLCWKFVDGENITIVDFPANGMAILVECSPENEELAKAVMDSIRFENPLQPQERAGA